MLQQINASFFLLVRLSISAFLCLFHFHSLLFFFLIFAFTFDCITTRCIYFPNWRIQHTLNFYFLLLRTNSFCQCVGSSSSFLFVSLFVVSYFANTNWPLNGTVNTQKVNERHWHKKKRRWSILTWIFTTNRYVHNMCALALPFLRSLFISTLPMCARVFFVVACAQFCFLFCDTLQLSSFFIQSLLFTGVNKWYFERNGTSNTWALERKTEKINVFE